MEKQAKRPANNMAYWIFIFISIMAYQYFFSAPAPQQVTYNQFMALVDSGRVQKIEWGDLELEAQATAAPRAEAAPGTSARPRLDLKAAKTESGAKVPAAANVKSAPASNAAPVPVPTETYVTQQIAGVDQTALLKKLLDMKIPVTGKVNRPSWLAQFLTSWILPIGIIFLIYFWIGKRLTRGLAGPMSFGKSGAKLYDQTQKEKATFDDVAGLEEPKEELQEVVDFLKNPGKYRNLGARIPKGVLLVGLPGTGKTLMARAVAGEAQVPFFSIPGSGFVEMFVGVGASRVRDLFEQAKKRAPCIIFIDELDAIGKSRARLGMSGSHDEQEQTLGQLLTEMDGFDPGIGVILMAATNRPEVLDPALLRPGRFDRQVVLDPPDLKGREAILKVHCRKVKVAAGLDLAMLAKRTPGMVGADLANVVNEAALAAARRGSLEVASADFEEAIDRLQMGLRKKSTVMNEEEKRRVAYHEAGHTLCALTVPKADPVHRVTIIPRSIGALGATLQLPMEERHLMTKQELKDRLCVMFGGRSAEETVFGDVSTGAQNDLERASETARRMVCQFGMSEKMGAGTFGHSTQLKYLNNPFGMGEERNYSEETAKAIDGEVKKMLETEHQRALEILRSRRDVLERIAQELLNRETLERSDLDRILADKDGGSKGKKG